MRYHEHFDKGRRDGFCGRSGVRRDHGGGRDVAGTQVPGVARDLVNREQQFIGKEIAQFLRVNPNTVYEMFKCGKIKSFGGGANGKSIRCMKTDFIAWLDGERNRSRNEAEEKEKFVPVTIAKGARRMSLIGGRG